MREKIAGKRLLVFDWGIGGLPLFHKIRGAFPAAALVYLSDSGNIPYGKQTARQLQERLLQIAAFARGEGISLTAVACNAMSSVLGGASSVCGGVEFLSLIHTFCAHITGAEKTARARGAEKRIGIIGGIRTLESGIYQKAFTEAGYRVSSCATQELSALIEAGDITGIPQVLEKAFSVLGAIDELVLACTHYPAAAPLIREMRPSLSLVDPGDALYAECARRLGGADTPDAGPARLYTTGDARLAAASAHKAFGFDGLCFQSLPLDLNA